MYFAVTCQWIAIFNSYYLYPLVTFGDILETLVTFFSPPTRGTAVSAVFEVVTCTRRARNVSVYNYVSHQLAEYATQSCAKYKTAREASYRSDSNCAEKRSNYTSVAQQPRGSDYHNRSAASLWHCTVKCVE
jgi:hypothetical protein